MDYIQKTVEEAIDLLVRDVTKVGSIPKSEAKQRIKDLLDLQASLFRKGLGEETKVDKDADQWETAVNLGSNSRRTQTLEKWKELGL